MMMIFPKMLEIHKLTTLGLGNGENPVGKNQSSLGPRDLGTLWNPPQCIENHEEEHGGTPSASKPLFGTPQCIENFCWDLSVHRKSLFDTLGTSIFFGLGPLSALKIFVWDPLKCIESLCLIPSVHRFFLVWDHQCIENLCLIPSVHRFFLVWDHQCIENLCLGSPVHRKY